MVVSYILALVVVRRTTELIELKRAEIRRQPPDPEPPADPAPLTAI